jgi:hypothetical protein
MTVPGKEKSFPWTVEPTPSPWGSSVENRCKITTM